MNCALEIGGNFSYTKQSPIEATCLEKSHFHFLTHWNHWATTSSGRGAIALLIRNLPHVKKVLLPIYTCDSIIQPFRNHHIHYDFYQINPDLSPDESSLLKAIAESNPDLIFFQSYYGFDTLHNIRHHFQPLREKGTVIVEDITHSLLQTTHEENVDYAIVSFRKWLEIPEGGAVLSNQHAISAEGLRPQEEKIPQLFLEASKLKQLYLSNGDESLKEIFRPMFYEVEHIFNEEYSPAMMSTLTKAILNQADWENIREKRRKNFQLLLSNIHNSCVHPVVNQLPSDCTPLYLPVLVPGKRDLLQKRLAQHKIYCPIHWPIPDELVSTLSEQGHYLYDNILSIVCDQRYNEDDMLRIVEVINQFE